MTINPTNGFSQNTAASGSHPPVDLYSLEFLAGLFTSPKTAVYVYCHFKQKQKQSASASAATLDPKKIDPKVLAKQVEWAVMQANMAGIAKK